MKLGEKQYGSNAAMPIFADTIKEIYNLGNYYHLGKIVKINLKEDWEIPRIIEKNICEDTCCLSTDWCDSYKEYFIESMYQMKHCKYSKSI